LGKRQILYNGVAFLSNFASASARDVIARPQRSFLYRCLSFLASRDKITHKALLDKNQRGELSPEKQEALNELLTGVDQVALLKARARYTMSLYKHCSERRAP